MGNCLALQDNVVRVMKADGEILEYKSPILAHQVLKEFSGHAISDSVPVLRQLQPNTKLLAGHLYYLVPPPPKAGKKKVRFAEPEVQGSQDSSSVVRIKVVISKQELQALLNKGGISVNTVDMLSLLPGEQATENEDKCHKKDDGFEGWKPALESIPELV
ncbi:uncharacterized protein LOC114751035 [Neltuma alba]|uniref:uncharacterized protein LOC114738487 n=1 Tax=Neltuma alba TaxID=207710 RepID=UPI0010A42410|nr:uncharacterized protein LOC114738487 [Prosopis alba]XP_028795530.1 uncharacterized protein LOC114751035 [Prosopis alba]